VGVGCLGRKMLRTRMKGSHARIDFVFGCVFSFFFSFVLLLVFLSRNTFSSLHGFIGHVNNITHKHKEHGTSD
jgi:ABC-type Mn2+/Zn2+ transport system permease subunit